MSVFIFFAIYFFKFDLLIRDMQDRLSFKFFMNWLNNTYNSALLAGKPIYNLP